MGRLGRNQQHHHKHTGYCFGSGSRFRRHSKHQRGANRGFRKLSVRRRFGRPSCWSSRGCDQKLQYEHRCIDGVGKHDSRTVPNPASQHYLPDHVRCVQCTADDFRYGRSVYCLERSLLRIHCGLVYLVTVQNGGGRPHPKWTARLFGHHWLPNGK